MLSPGYAYPHLPPPAVVQPVTTSEIAPGAVVQIFVHPYVRQEPGGVDTTTFSQLGIAQPVSPSYDPNLKEGGRDA